MLPENLTSRTISFLVYGQHFKRVECATDAREVVLAVRRPKKIGILLFWQKGTDAAQLISWQINFVLPQELEYPGKLLQDVCKRMDYMPEDLSRRHRSARLQWCHQHRNWTDDDCSTVLFSDESRFSLSSDCRRKLIWHKVGSVYRLENILERD